MNSNLASENQNPPPSLAVRLIPFLIVLAAGLAYYASYWHYWFNPHDESGTACLIAQRLMKGERPWVDFEPGYNIGWFYPLVGLFHLTGVNFLAARAWFFALSIVTALLGCGIVTRVSGARWLGLATGLILVVFPGSQFKNYIPLAEAANTACLIHLCFLDPAVRRKWLGGIALGGVVLGLTFLVRVELGYFFTAIWALLFLVSLFDRRLPFFGHVVGVFLGVSALIFGVVVAQAPLYVNLRARGLESQYWAEYTDWLRFLRASVQQRLAPPKPRPVVAAAAAPAPEATPASAPAPMADAAAPAVATAPAPDTTASAPVHNPENGDRSVLPRKPLRQMLHPRPWDPWMEALLTYAPLIGFALFFVAGSIGFLVTVPRRDFSLTAVPLLWLLLVGGSLTTFPQFFFFRPDRPHLSEFMPGYIIAMMGAVCLLWPKGPEPSRARRLLAIAVALFLGGQFAVFAVYDLHHASGGTIVARLGRKIRFRGENGVYVHASKREAEMLQGVYDAVRKFSKPGEDVICFPYMPGYNVMTNRPTYLRNVYVDNATRGEHWAENTIHDFEQKHPAVVIVSNREINGTSASRFSHWGAPVYAYLKKNYTEAAKLEDRFDTVEIFVPPSAAAEPAPASTPAEPSAPATPKAPATPAPAATPGTPAETPAPPPATPATSPPAVTTPPLPTREGTRPTLTAPPPAIPAPAPAATPAPPAPQ